MVRADHGELGLVQGRGREGEEIHALARGPQAQRFGVGPLLQAPLVRSFQPGRKVKNLFFVIIQ